MNFVKGAAGLKVKEIPGYVGKYANDNWQPVIVQRRVSTWLNTYKKQYIDTGSPKPLFDVLGYGFVGSYIFSWPREYAHMKHEQEAKLKGDGKH